MKAQKLKHLLKLRIRRKDGLINQLFTLFDLVANITLGLIIVLSASKNKKY